MFYLLMNHPKTSVLSFLLLSVLIAGSVFSQVAPMTPMERKPLFEIRTNGEYVSVNIFSDHPQPTATGKLSAITRDKDAIHIGTARFEQDSLRIGSDVIAYDMIFDAQLELSDSKEQIITFVQRETGTTGTTKLRGNRRSFTDSLSVQAGDFVRGMVFSIDAPVTIEGEVNRSVVSLFQDISLTPGSVVRGDVITLTGKLHIDRASAVYGESYGASVSHRGKQRYGIDFSDMISVGARFSYDRVDGAAPMATLQFHNPDSTVPEFSVAAGYAFASKRLRLHLTARQFLLRRTPVVAGAEFYRKLQPSGDFALPTTENTLAAILAREDFREYYEAIGGSIWAAVYPDKFLSFKLGYRYEETNWRDAHPNLWSVFGGNKRFPSNYRYADSAQRETIVPEIDTTTNGALQLGAEYSNRGEDFFNSSSWLFKGQVDWSLPSLGSDFDYSRYLLQAARIQKLHTGGFGFARLSYGGRGGDVPLHHQFFLGGPLDLRGYKPNRLTGDYFVLFNAEYRCEIPKTMFALGLFYDVAAIIDKTQSLGNDLSNAPGIGDAGLAFYLFNEKGIVSVGWPTSSITPDGKKPVVYARINFGF